MWRRSGLNILKHTIHGRFGTYVCPRWYGALARSRADRPSSRMWHDRHIGVHCAISALILSMLPPCARIDDTLEFGASLCFMRCHSIGCSPQWTHRVFRLILFTYRVTIFRFWALILLIMSRVYNTRRRCATGIATMNAPRSTSTFGSVRIHPYNGLRDGVADAVLTEGFDQAGFAPADWPAVHHAPGMFVGRTHQAYCPGCARRSSSSRLRRSSSRSAAALSA